MRRGEHLLPRVEKERCATQGRHPSFAPQFCNSPHGKRRRTTNSAVLARPFEPKDYGALPPCDGTQARKNCTFRPLLGDGWRKKKTASEFDYSAFRETSAILTLGVFSL